MSRYAFSASANVPSRISIIVSISWSVIVSAGMKRSESGRGALTSRPRARARSATRDAMSRLRSSASSKPRPRTSPQPCRRDSRVQAVRQIVAGLRHAREEAGFRDLLDHRAADRRHQRIAAERAALVAILEAGDVAVGDQCCQRHAAAETLGQRHDVGRYAGVLETEHAPGAADPGLDLIEDEQHALVAGQRAQGAQDRGWSPRTRRPRPGSVPASRRRSAA